MTYWIRDGGSNLLRVARLTAVHIALYFAACVPNLEPDNPPCTSQAASYDSDPNGIKNAAMEDAIIRYQALDGQWVADVPSAPDSSEFRALGFSIETRPRSEIEVLTGCGSIAVVASCQVDLSGSQFPGLSGQSIQLSLGFLSRTGYKVFGSAMLDSSYDASLDFVSLTLGVTEEDATAGSFMYGLKPRRNPDGSMSQYGYEVSWTNIRKAQP